MRNPPNEGLPPVPVPQADETAAAEHRPANEAMSRILNMRPLRIALDASSGAIAHHSVGVALPATLRNGLSSLWAPPRNG